MTNKTDDINFEISDDCPEEIAEQFKNYVDAFDEAEWRQPFEFLLDSGISLPPASELSETELSAKLWEVINALSLLAIYLESTDHLSDRELYTLLYEDVLREETVFQSGDMMNMNCHIDLVSSGSQADTDLYLKYYADDDDRAFWLKEFPDDVLPSHEPLPFDRDCQLPKPTRKIGRA
ncbi:MAG: hypothetical protein NTW85_01560 [Methylococcales bacterium]|nr:hypothetical protein [Methylococcales bacterium]